MALVIDLAVTLEKRRRMLDQVDQAIADFRRLLPRTKQKRRAKAASATSRRTGKKAQARRA